jgi:Exocyst complex component Sec8 C-terminal/Exocyst complex component Sec8 N-terminal
LDRVRKHGEIPADFFLDTEAFNAFDHWDDSPEQLNEWRSQIDRAVDQVVELTHKGFTRATSKFSHIITSYTKAKQLQTELDHDMRESQRLMGVASDTLHSYWTANSTATQVLDILYKIQYVMLVPDEFQQYVDRKQYLHAVKLITHGHKLMMSPELCELGVLHELRDHLVTRKDALKTMLVDELLRHMYTERKSGGNEANVGGGTDESHSRMTANNVADTGSIQDRGIRGSILDNVQLATSNTSRSSAHAAEAYQRFSPFVVRQSRNNIGAPQSNQPDADDLIHIELKSSYLDDPQRDLNLYILMLVEALFRLDRLSFVRYKMQQNIRGQLRLIIDRETELLRARVTAGGTLMSNADQVMSLVGLSSRNAETGEHALLELVERLFELFTLVLKNHIHVLEIVRSKLSEPSKSSVPGAPAPVVTNATNVNQEIDMLKDLIWAAIQGEVQLLLSRYLQVSARRVEDYATSKRDEKDSKSQGDIPELTFSFADSEVPSVSRMSQIDFDASLVLGSRQTSQSSLFATNGAAGSGDPAGASGTGANGVGANNNAANNDDAMWIVPSPYHVTAVYRPVVVFTDQATSMLSGTRDDVQPEEEPLRTFIDMLVLKSFLPRVEADANVRIMKILHGGGGAFIPLEVKLQGDRLGETAMLVRSVTEVAELLERMLSDMARLPNVTEQYLDIIQHVLQQYIAECKSQYQEVTKGMYSASRLTDHSMIRLLRTDPAYQQYVQAFGGKLAGDVKMSPAESQKSTQHTDHPTTDNFYTAAAAGVYGQLMSGLMQLNYAQLMFDSNQWQTLAVLCDSLEWLAIELARMTDPDYLLDAGASPVWLEQSNRSQLSSAAARVRIAFGTGQRSILARRSIALLQRGGMSMSALQQPGLTGVLHTEESALAAMVWSLPTVGSMSSAPLLERRRAAMLSKCRDLAELCLFTMRFELQVHCFYFLSSLQTTSYNLSVETLEPDIFVMDMNKDLSRVEEELRKYGSLMKLQYVLNDLPRLITTIWIRSLPHMKNQSFTSNGVMQVQRNLFAVQQNLTNIVTNSFDHCFDRARQYFHLLGREEDDDVARFQAEHSNMFTPEEVCR